ncbi:MAG: hypothetical protein DHS20C15_25650 [Planctomycetota bacterium]|nr:MAG: hypothetical protein DHS20C15_25650 [Planctomycetota bacterium]
MRTRPLLALALASLAAACGDDAASERATTEAATEAVTGAESGAKSDQALDADAPPASKPRVVLLTQSAGYEHAVVKRAQADAPSLVERALAERWSSRAEVQLLRDATQLDAARLADTDVLLLYTTGELPVPGGASALVEWVRAGGALLGVHSVSDTFHEQPEFLELLGGEFDGHPWHQRVRLLVVDREHPATAALPEPFELHDEIYEYKRRAENDLRVLLRLDPKSVDFSRAKHPHSGHPMSWVREVDAGRVFHTGLGHRDELWRDEAFLGHLDGALSWLLREG